jgi:hypothetical protein
MPLSAKALRFLRPLHRGVALDSLSLEMCQPTETTGRCVLQIDLTHAFVTGLDYAEGDVSGEAVAVLTFAPAIEKVTGRLGTMTRSVTYDLANLDVTADTGGVPDGSPSPFLTTLTGPTTKLSTSSWSHSISAARPVLSGGGGTGEVRHDPVRTRTATGPGTVDLLARLLNHTANQTATISGCPADPCTQTVVLDDVVVTQVTLGSPTLTDKSELSYRTIAWDRSQGTTHTIYRWDLAGNREF